ncbi:MAG TPA: hypothetical protein PLL32_10310 [Anaeromyxobacteraceae bacterium]|nr:hypothetical protein [Anaeromyxobacteraceae bacterium]
MNRYIRAALVVTLRLGLSVLCGDAWGEEGPRDRGGRSEALVEAIWSAP